MTFLLLSFIAGILTVAAPCVLPILPVIIGGSLKQRQSHPSESWRPVYIALGLVISIVLFTLLLRASTALLVVPSMVWSLLAGGTIFMFGISYVFPESWEQFAQKFQIGSRSQKRLSTIARKAQNPFSAFLLGAALGPVFNSCSPTYGLIVAAILPVSFWAGLGYLLVYVLGLAGALLAIAYTGRKAVKGLGWLVNPDSPIRKAIGVLFILVGLFVITGLDKRVEVMLLDMGWYQPFAAIEQQLR